MQIQQRRNKILTAAQSKSKITDQYNGSGYKFENQARKKNFFFGVLID